VLVGGEDDDLSGGSESMQAVLAYVDAAEEGDCEALIDLVTEESVQMIGDGGRSDAIAACEDALSSGEQFAVANLGNDPRTEEANVGTEATVTLITTADGGTEETYNAFDVRREAEPGSSTSPRATGHRRPN
jgi:hypothetical protein